METNKNTFRILSLDGGGVRGVFSAHMLQLIEEKLNINIHDTFNLIVGTSTGSIVAASVAIKYAISQLVDDYEAVAPRIFKPRPTLLKCLSMNKSKYKSDALENFLRDKLSDIKLGEIEKPLIINATNVSVGGVFVFKSKYQEKQRQGDYSRDGEIPLYKAVLASCAAPTYFDPVDINGTLICDGGLWANNPALVGYTDAIKNFQQRPENIRILSIGTGMANQFYSPAKHWGLGTGWGGTKLVDFVMSCQTQFPQNCLGLIMPKKVCRINPPIDNWELDNYKIIPILKSKADSEFTNRSEEIKAFLQTGENNHET